MSAPDPIRVLLVDDHLVVRKGLVHVLSAVADIEVIAEAENGEEALFLCQKLKPDIIVMDVKMDGMGGVAATRHIADHNPYARIIGLSTFAHPETVNAMIEAGAKGYLLKDLSGAELSEAIRRVHDGEILTPDALIESTTDQAGPVSDEDFRKVHDNLGEQQKRVLALMTKGFTNPEIAEHLHISKPTARYHVSAILRKLDVSNRSEAVAVAIRSKLVSPDDF